VADPIRWQRLIFHLLDELETYAEPDEDPALVERQAVHLYMAIHAQIIAADWRRNGDTDAEAT
jgi:hypothetical protein